MPGVYSYHCFLLFVWCGYSISFSVWISWECNQLYHSCLCCTMFSLFLSFHLSNVNIPSFSMICVSVCIFVCSWFFFMFHHFWLNQKIPSLSRICLSVCIFVCPDLFFSFTYRFHHFDWINISLTSNGCPLNFHISCTLFDWININLTFLWVSFFLL